MLIELFDIFKMSSSSLKMQQSNKKEKNLLNLFMVSTKPEWSKDMITYLWSSELVWLRFPTLTHSK